MKILFLICLYVLSIYAKQNIVAGGGAYMQTQPYKNVDAKIVPSPVIFYEYKNLYVRWTRVGAYVFGKKSNDISWGVSLTAQPRIYGYESSDIKGMGNRKSTIESGIAYSISKNKTSFELLYLTDILDTQKRWVINSKLNYEFKVGKLNFYPSLLLSYQSSAFTNYYYGVKQSETTPTREYYNPNAGLQIGVQTYINYPLTNKLSAFFNLRIDMLSNQAKDSPLVEDNYIYSGLASLIYKFEF